MFILICHLHCAASDIAINFMDIQPAPPGLHGKHQPVVATTKVTVSVDIGRWPLKCFTLPNYAW